MLKVIKVLPCVLLLGCTHQPTVSDAQYNSIQSQVEAVKKTIPKECMTDAINQQLSAIDAQALAYKVSCDAAVKAEKERADRLLWWAIVAAAMFFGVTLWRIK